MLPVPVDVKLPSIADETLLTCRVYALSLHASPSESSIRNAAVVAHPYATLGGDFNDPVVLLTAEELCNIGYVVVTFNFRGADDNHRAATSWTSKPEQADYKSVVCLLVQLMRICSPSTHAKLRLLLAGYSYGSMIASAMNPAAKLTDEVECSEKQTLIRAKAQDVASQFKEASSMSMTSDANLRFESIETSYLLISPLLPPVTSFLTMFSGDTKCQHLEAHKTLVVYGSEDHFTSCVKLRRWVSKLGIQAEEVTGAGHFWQDLNTVEKLRHAISEWAK